MRLVVFNPDCTLRPTMPGQSDRECFNCPWRCFVMDFNQEGSVVGTAFVNKSSKRPLLPKCLYLFDQLFGGNQEVFFIESPLRSNTCNITRFLLMPFHI